LFRVDDGKVVEHWNVMQEDVHQTDNVNGNGMFTGPKL